MMTLSDFLIQNPQTDVTEEFYLSPRFAEKGFKFKIKAITGDQFGQYQKRCMVMSKGTKVGFNNQLWQELIILNHTVDPNFKDAATLSAAGCATPEQFLHRSLLSGEQAELVNRITALSGFDADPEALAEEAKNSSGGETENPGTPISASTSFTGDRETL